MGINNFEVNFHGRNVLLLSTLIKFMLFFNYFHHQGEKKRTFPGKHCLYIFLLFINMHSTIL